MDFNHLIKILVDLSIKSKKKLDLACYLNNFIQVFTDYYYLNMSS